MRVLEALLGLAVTATAVLARSSTGDRVLVVLDPQISKDSYSKLWGSLQDRGYILTFKGPKDDSADLVKFGEKQYDHLVMFAPSASSFSAPLSPKSIVDAQFLGVNTLHLLSPQLSDLSRDTFREYDLEFADHNQTLLDAFSYPAGSTPATVLLPSTSCLIENGPLLSLSTLTGGPIVFPSGTVHSTGANPYLIDILHAGKTSYLGLDRELSEEEGEAASKSGKEAVLTGRKAVLVSAMQSRDNTRVGFVGSGEMFKDEWWGQQVKTVDGQTVETGNAGFAEDLTKWIFQETGVLRVIDSTHHRVGEDSPRDLYRIKDELSFSLTLAQHQTSANSSSIWKPVSLPDLQLDYTMLDPFVRKALPINPTARPSVGTTYTTTFKAPDRHGVFKFVVEYWRPGWTYVRSSTTASLTPFRHTDYPKFVVGAWPFYSSAITVSAAFLLFCAAWVGLGPGGGKGKKKAE